MNAFIAYLLNNIPWLAFILISVFVTWKISKYHALLESTRNKVDDLPCERHKEDILKSDNRYNSLEKIVSSTNDMVIEINKWLMKFDNDMIDKLAKKGSPLKMTPVGKILFEQSYGKEAIDNNIEFLLEELEKINPKTAYDVEEESLGFLLKNVGHEMFEEIKKFIYYSPDVIIIKDPETEENNEVKITLQYIVKLMSIYLRDIYLSKHPDIQ